MKKENIPLFLGLLIPVLLILFVAISIYLPSLMAKPKYSFVYAAGGDYYAADGFAVQNGKLIKREIKQPVTQTYREPVEPRLFLYNVVNNTATEISFEEAQKFNLSARRQSPDGFQVSSGSDNYSIFSLLSSRGSFYGDKYIRGHGISKRLNLCNENSLWNYSFHFIGWVI